jgi:hypothetical protein
LFAAPQVGASRISRLYLRQIVPMVRLLTLALVKNI